MTPLTIICWRWRPRAGYRSQFGPQTVRVLRDMVRRHYPFPHRFVCVDDSPEEIDADIETIRDVGDFAAIQSPHGEKNPSCYRRLRMFHPDAAATFGPRFVSIDLDCVITGDLSALWNRTEDVVMWGDYTNPANPYNGSMMLMNAGARPHVWTKFDPEESPRIARREGFFGSDQAWLCYALGPNEAKWTTKDGVYSYRNHVKPASGALPGNARVVMFHGSLDPWQERAQQMPWVAQNYRAELAVAS